MESVLQDIRFIRIAVAKSQTEAIKIRLMLDRTMIPYRTVNENLVLFFRGGCADDSSLIEFQVPSQYAEAAMESLNDLFEVHEDAVPEYCPACESPVDKNKLECPACGLFLC